MSWGFEEGKVYNRRADIHAKFGGQQQGGIITPSQHPLVIIVTGEEGLEHGYADRTRDDGVFEYFGEGQVGDMVMQRGNLAVASHAADGKSLLLLRKTTDGLRFLGASGISINAAVTSETGASVGFHFNSARKETRLLDGCPISCIIEAELYEISYCWGAGAVNDAFVLYGEVDFDNRFLKNACGIGKKVYLTDFAHSIFFIMLFLRTNFARKISYRVRCGFVGTPRRPEPFPVQVRRDGRNVVVAFSWQKLASAVRGLASGSLPVGHRVNNRSLTRRRLSSNLLGLIPACLRNSTNGVCLARGRASW
jgi:hypothetical protein